MATGTLAVEEPATEALMQPRDQYLGQRNKKIIQRNEKMLLLLENHIINSKMCVVYRVDDVHDAIVGVSVALFQVGFLDVHLAVDVPSEAERVAVDGLCPAGERPRRSPLAAHGLCGKTFTFKRN